MATETAVATETKPAETATETKPTETSDGAPAATAPETKAAETAVVESKTDGKPAATGIASGAPAEYALTNPDETFFDAKDLASLTAVARANNWTNDQAQAALENHLDALKAQADTFLKETEADPEIGGPKLEETQTLAKKGLDRVMTLGGEAFGAELKGFLRKTGYENHRLTVRVFRIIGEAMAEDRPPTGGAGGGGGAAAKLLPNSEVFYGKNPLGTPPADA